MAKGTPGLNPVLIHCVDSSCETPIKSPPMSAPHGLPMPPRMVAANIGSRNSNPASKRSCDCTPNMIPAIAISAPPIAQVAWRMRSVSMPEMSASSALSAVARIALPSVVRYSNTYTASASATVSAMIRS